MPRRHPGLIIAVEPDHELASFGSIASGYGMLTATDGEIVSNHAKILLNHASEAENAIEIYARRQDVDRVNNENISRLPSQAISYKCVDFFEWKSHHKDDKSLEKYSRRLDGDDTLQQLVWYSFLPSGLY